MKNGIWRDAYHIYCAERCKRGRMRWLWLVGEDWAGLKSECCSLATALYVHRDGRRSPVAITPPHVFLQITVTDCGVRLVHSHLLPSRASTQARSIRLILRPKLEHEIPTKRLDKEAMILLDCHFRNLQIESSSECSKYKQGSQERNEGKDKQTFSLVMYYANTSSSHAS